MHCTKTISGDCHWIHHQKYLCRELQKGRLVNHAQPVQFAILEPACCSLAMCPGGRAADLQWQLSCSPFKWPSQPNTAQALELVGQFTRAGSSGWPPNWTLNPTGLYVLLQLNSLLWNCQIGVKHRYDPLFFFLFQAGVIALSKI